MTRIEVSREFEPVDELAVEARYSIYFSGGEVDHINLSKRRFRDGFSTQFDEVEDIDPSKVPEGVLQQAADELRSMGSKVARAGRRSRDTDETESDEQVEVTAAPVEWGTFVQWADHELSLSSDATDDGTVQTIDGLLNTIEDAMGPTEDSQC